jgi:hypothetical protein
MTNLDDKLREILTKDGRWYYGYRGKIDDEAEERITKAIAQIKQAFKDDDWVKLAQEAEYLTGQEWLDRFEKYYVAMSFRDNDTATDVWEAAKGASGLT